MTHTPTRAGHVPDVGSTVHRFDKIEIIFPKRLEELQSLLPLHQLRAHAVNSKLEHYSRFQYRAHLLVVAPDQEYWEILASYEDYLGEYKICLLELACDTFYPTEREAVEAARAALQQLRKKYHRRGEVKVVGGTAYFEDRRARTNLVAYARADKRTGQPLMRIELRLKNAGHIREKTGIATLSDLRDFDFAPFMAKHIVLEKINYEQLGRWINNIPRGAEITTDPTGFTYNHAASAGHGFCRIHEISSPAELRHHFRKEQERIRAKLGLRTIWEGEQKCVSLSYYKLNSFFVRVDPGQDPY